MTLPLLFGLSYYSGFERTTTRVEDAEDAFVAFGVGFIASALILLLFGVIQPGMPLGEIIGKIAMQTVPASIGAMRRQQAVPCRRGRKDDEDEKRAQLCRRTLPDGGGRSLRRLQRRSDRGDAPHRLSDDRIGTRSALAARVDPAAARFVYTVGFAGQEERPARRGFWLTFLHFTVAGYGIALVGQPLCLWTFERRPASNWRPKSP